jgi:prepilin-type N-terminal cleavage/methylation domain-containing protein
MKRESGFTLIEIIMAMAIFLFAYLFISRIFMTGFAAMRKARNLSRAVYLAQNEMARLRAIKDPLYIGLDEKDIETYEQYEEKYEDPKYKPLAGKSTEDPKPYITEEDFSRRTICIETREGLKEENGERFWGREEDDEEREMAILSPTVPYERTIEREIIDEMPKLVQVWVTVTWADPHTPGAEEQEYNLTTYLAP